MTAPSEILAFLEQQAAQRQPVELLLARQLARGDAFQCPQRGLPFALALLVKVQRQATQLAFAVTQSAADGGKRGVVVEQGLKVPGEQPFKLFRSPGHGLSNARTARACTNEIQ